MSRDAADLYKDKIEVSLDGRQIFYLFFGGSVIVGMVFVLGVMVGRRVEARGHVDHAHTTANVDPLAALDRLEGSGGMAFQKALLAPVGVPDVSGGAAAVPTVTADVDKKIDKLAADKKAAAEKPAEPVADKPADKSGDKPAADKPKKKHKDEPKPDKAEAKSNEPKPEGKDDAHYTLQLSSFQDKSEAETFLDNIKAAGFEPTLTQAEVEGKGTFYRIRLGNYRSLDAANEAKGAFEKASRKSAYVMRL